MLWGIIRQHIRPMNRWRKSLGKSVEEVAEFVLQEGCR